MSINYSKLTPLAKTNPKVLPPMSKSSPKAHNKRSNGRRLNEES